MPLETLEKRLEEIIAAGYTLGTTDLYGGEVMLLSDEYLLQVHELLMRYGARDVELITNLSSYRASIIENEKFGISVSYDFEHREQCEHVWKNLLKIERPFTILTLGTPELVRTPVKNLVEQINLLSNCKNWEIKPYSSNQANQLQVGYDEYEAFVKAIIEYPDKNFRFLNEMAVSGAVAGVNNAFSDDHVYITPSGSFGVLEFDDKDNEFFLELPNFDAYLDWTIEEKNRVYTNEFCGSCNYMGRCLSEHLRDVKSLEHSCNGFHNLIVWYEREKA